MTERSNIELETKFYCPQVNGINFIKDILLRGLERILGWDVKCSCLDFPRKWVPIAIQNSLPSILHPYLDEAGSLEYSV